MEGVWKKDGRRMERGWKEDKDRIKGEDGWRMEGAWKEAEWK